MKVEVTASGAIYVDGARITNRTTKPWGGSRTTDTFHCAREMLHDSLKARGHSNLIPKIDAEPFQ